MWMGASQAMCYLSTSGRSKIIAKMEEEKFLEFCDNKNNSPGDLLILCIRLSLVLIILTMTALIGRQYANRSPDINNHISYYKKTSGMF